LTPLGEWVSHRPGFGSVELAEAYARGQGSFVSLFGWRIIGADGKVHQTWLPPFAIDLTENAQDGDEVVALFRRARGESLLPGTDPGHAQSRARTIDFAFDPTDPTSPSFSIEANLIDTSTDEATETDD
jgi:hypothetical protein